VHWETDAEYQYYAHGPLARVLLGDQKVQAVDYAYTLQGWLKGVNSESVGNANTDMGQDYTDNGIAKDVFGFSLNYYDGDYSPIKATNPFVISEQNSKKNTSDLYNGNIKTMVTSLTDTDQNPLTTLQNNYKYDQLNRIKSYTGLNVGDYSEAYSAQYSYDRNGNLETLSRSYNEGDTFDEFSYKYDQTSDPITGEIYRKNNQLHVVEDPKGQRESLNDLPNQMQQLADAGITYDPKIRIRITTFMTKLDSLLPTNQKV